jgi:hypothetical protein
MKKAIVSLCALSLAVPAVAAAHDTTFESSVSIDFVEGPPVKRGVSNPLFVGGFVFSKKDACIANRKVKLYVITNIPEKRQGPTFDKELVDTDRTSDNGAWAGYGNFVGADGAMAKVVKKDIGPKGHDHICGADTDIDT